MVRREIRYLIYFGKKKKKKRGRFCYKRTGSTRCVGLEDSVLERTQTLFARSSFGMVTPHIPLLVPERKLAQKYYDMREVFYQVNLPKRSVTQVTVMLVERTITDMKAGKVTGLPEIIAALLKKSDQVSHVIVTTCLINQVVQENAMACETCMQELV